MAESHDYQRNNTKNLGKVFQRKVSRTKEMVMRNLGKADQTKDDEFENNITLFNEQHNGALKFQRELKHYAICLKEISTANYNLHKALNEIYENNWIGFTEFCAAQEDLPELWSDYLNKVNDEVYAPLSTYISQFPDLKARIAKRNRKLTDYDSARHNFDSQNKKNDAAKLAKVAEDLHKKRLVYEAINAELREELPAFHYRRINVISSLISSLFSAEVIFQTETAKLKSQMESAADALGHDIVQNHPKLISENRSIRVETIGAPEALYAEKSYKPQNNKPTKMIAGTGILEKSQEQSLNHSPIITSNKSLNVNQSTIANNAVESQHSFGDLEGSKVSIDNKVVMHKQMDLESINGEHLFDELEAVNNNNDSEDDSTGLANHKTNSKLRIIYKVQATHEYIGDDIDELSFSVGEIINVVPFDDPEEQDDGWLTGIKESTKEKGVFPENFTKRI